LGWKIFLRWLLKIISQEKALTGVYKEVEKRRMPTAGADE
jgi:hypothetical protein